MDLHEYDFSRQRWREVVMGGALPKPRRRHSAVFVSGSLALFGGFDGNFFNDLHLLDFRQSRSQLISIQPSSIS
jgi:hypothetical protein